MWAAMDKNLGTLKSKLFKLKEWLTLPETTRYLSSLFDEEVSEADVLRLALDGHLKLSVHLPNPTNVIRGDVVSEEETIWQESKLERHILERTYKAKFPEFDGDISKVKFATPTIMKSLNIDGKRFINLDEKVTAIKGVYDLPLFGGERLDIEHEYLVLTDGPDLVETLLGLDGAFVSNLDGSVVYQIQESFDNNEFFDGSIAQFEKLKEYIANKNVEEERGNKLLADHKKKREQYLEKRKKKNYEDNYYPSGALPRDRILVVRTSALLDLQELVSENQLEAKQISPKTEKSDLHIIGALVEIIIEGQLYSSEEKLRDHIADQYRGYSGCASRTLAGRFAEAKKLLRLAD